MPAYLLLVMNGEAISFEASFGDEALAIADQVAKDHGYDEHFGVYVEVQPLEAEPVQAPQRQDSLHAQMVDVRRLATRIGCYDAADWIRTRFFDHLNRSV